MIFELFHPFILGFGKIMSLLNTNPDLIIYVYNVVNDIMTGNSKSIFRKYIY